MSLPRIYALATALLFVAIAAAPAAAFTKGDVNDDGSIDPADVPDFIAVLLGQNTDPAAVCAADVNSNGDTDADDIQSFVDAVLCGCNCALAADCGLGEDCIGGFCQPTGAIEIELSDGNAPCHDDPNRPLEDGGEFMLCGGFQGLTELYLKTRLTGFDPGATVDWSYNLRFVGAQNCPKGACPPLETCIDGVCSIGFGTFTGLPTSDTGCGVNELDFFDILNPGPVALDGQVAILSVTVTDSDNPALTVSTTFQVTLDVPLFCFSQGQCPPDHVCMGNYCFPN